MLLQKIQTDKMEARRASNKKLLDLLTLLHSEAMRPGKDNGNRDSTDAEVIQVIRKMVAGNEETIGKLLERNEGELSGKDETREKELREENRVLKGYLPRQLTDDELIKIVSDFINESEEKPKLGDVMKYLRANHEGKYDGKFANAIIKDML